MKIFESNWWQSSKNVFELKPQNDEEFNRYIEDLNSGEIASISPQKLVITSKKNMLEFTPIIGGLNSN